MTQPGPGPKPGGPTHPTPTGPPHGNGHALPPIDSDPRPGGSDTRPSGGGVVAARGSDPFPQKIDQIHSAVRYLTQALNAVSRITDVLSAPDDDQPVHDFLEAQVVGGGRARPDA